LVSFFTSTTGRVVLSVKSWIRLVDVERVVVVVSIIAVAIVFIALITGDADLAGTEEPNLLAAVTIFELGCSDKAWVNVGRGLRPQ
jgi:hypothetical protein